MRRWSRRWREGESECYRQLPALVYQIQTKWRDDTRPRAGLISTREFTMKDAYSLDRQYQAQYRAYFRIFGRCALPAIAAESDVGMMGGSMAHEFMHLSPVGENTILLCDGCGYTATHQMVRFRKTAPEPEEPKPVRWPRRARTPSTPWPYSWTSRSPARRRSSLWSPRRMGWRGSSSPSFGATWT